MPEPLRGRVWAPISSHQAWNAVFEHERPSSPGDIPCSHYLRTKAPYGLEGCPKLERANGARRQQRRKRERVRRADDGNICARKVNASQSPDQARAPHSFLSMPLRSPKPPHPEPRMTRRFRGAAEDASPRRSMLRGNIGEMRCLARLRTFSFEASRARASRKRMITDESGRSAPKTSILLFRLHLTKLRWIV